MATQAVLRTGIVCFFLAPVFARGASANPLAIANTRIYTSAAAPRLPRASILTGDSKIIGLENEY
jgi:hypothetical protein